MCAELRRCACLRAVSFHAGPAKKKCENERLTMTLRFVELAGPMTRSSLFLLLVPMLAACGGAPKEAEAPAPAVKQASSEEAQADPKPSDPEEKKAADAAPTELPTECAKKGGSTCTPPEAFVNKLCQGSYPSVAIAMFKKGTPWVRGYLTRKTKAWNASGGASESDMLEFDEEVLILRQRSADLGGMQVSGAGGGYDALRWNGGCVTLAKEELTEKLPPKPKSAHVEWRLLDDSMQTAMRNDDKVTKAYRARQKECQGATMGTVSSKCVKADAALSDIIVDYVRNGGDVGKPDRLPE
jgi:hypothetical protein